MGLPVSWRPRAVPLVPCGLAVRGPAARALGRALLAWDAPRLAALRGCAGDDALIVLGDEAALPWIDGACFLGRDPAAPAWLVPTNRAPDVPLAIFVEALGRQLTGTGPWAVLSGAGGLTVLGLQGVGPIAATSLEAWVART